MALLDRIRRIGDKKKIIHVAITMDASEADMEYAIKHKKMLEEVYDERNKTIQKMIKTQVKEEIPIMTLELMSAGKKDPEQFKVLVDSFVRLFELLKENKTVMENRIKIIVLGKWYDLPGKLVDTIKETIEATRDFDEFFLNLCINYDGREEIVDACKLIAIKVKAGKIEPETISIETIKENLYSSGTIPPQLIINNDGKQMSSLLLWDSVGARIVFTGKPWQEFHKSDLIRAMSAS